MAWQHYAGVANVSTRVPITPESLFPAASMGKQPFAYGVLLLAQQGKLDLETAHGISRRRGSHGQMVRKDYDTASAQPFVRTAKLAMEQG
jgi:Beta-lactamase